MKKYESYARVLPWFMALVLSVLLAACGGGRDPILGSGQVGAVGGVAPTVTAVNPSNNAIGVPTNTKVGVTFTQAMDPLSITRTTFTLKQGATPVDGVTSYSGVNAVFAPTSALANNTTYTATITTGAKDLTGNALANDYVWSWTTGAATDTIAPTVIGTINANGATNVATNTKVGATFSEGMDPLSITATTFTLKQGATPVAGTNSYSGVNTVFTPTSALANNTTYTATITTGAKDLAGNAMANDYVWSWTTGAAADTTPPTVTLVSPVDLATNVATNSAVTATFSEAMDPLTVSTATFTVAGITGTVGFDAIAKMATFTPSAALANNTTYTATIKGGTSGVKDVAANAMVLDKVWSFTTAAGPALVINLGRLATFGIAATAGVTNTTTAPLTTINGDVALDPVSGATCNSVAIDAAGGFGLCGSNASTPILHGTVVSPLYPDAGVTSGAIKNDLLAAYLSITPPDGPPAAGSLGGATSIPAGTTLGALTGSALVQGDNLFTPGVYRSITSILITDDLTLDAQGNPDAIFVFQSSSTVGTADGSVGTHPRILLINGAKASNVYWQAGTSATLGTSTEWQGNILAGASITMKTGANSCGRLLAGAFTAGAFVFDSNVVSVPGNANAPASCK